MKIVFSLILSIVFLYSQELLLDDLLQKYEDSKELYLETKKESAGHLIVFSRSDLDKMQAYTLNDVLKTIRMFNLQTKRTGMTTLVKSASSQTSNNPVKIFINTHELNSATIGNALTQYGKMGLYFIDHIEIYQAGNSVVFGSEPGSMIIKLYTKEPSRENGAISQLSVDNRGSLNIRAVDAQVFGEYSYLANVDVSKNNYSTINTNNSELSRDGQRGQFYFKFSKEDSYDIEVGATHEKYDPFTGFGSAPSGGNINTKNFYLQATKHFDNNLNVTLSVSTEKLDVSNEDSNGILLAGGSTTNELAFNVGTDIYSTTIEKRFVEGSNDLFLGAQFKHLKFNIDSYKSNDVEKPIEWGPTELDIYMAYLENLYNINENHLIALSTKVDHYENDFSSSSTQHILRLGYVALLNQNWAFKLFAIHSYTYPSFVQTTFSPNYNVNPSLKATTSNTLTAEAIYKLNKTIISIGGGCSEVENAIVYNMTKKQYINNPDKGEFSRVYAKIEHKFNLKNKLTIEYFKLFKEKYFTPGNGLLIQLFNKVWKFDIYNELVYRSDYTSLDGVDMSAGYDYTLGIIYPFSRDIGLKLKGENLLDRAQEVPINGVDIPVMERRAILTMEYIF